VISGSGDGGILQECSHVYARYVFCYDQYLWLPIQHITLLIRHLLRNATSSIKLTPAYSLIYKIFSPFLAINRRDEHRLRVFESRVLRRIFGPKRDEVTGEGRKLHSEELYDLYCSPNVVRVIKSRRMRWVGHVARLGRVEVHTKIWW